MTLKSRLDTYTVIIDCIVVDHVTNRIPAVTLRRKDFDIPRNIKLADPQFHESSDIDILVGAEIFWDLLCVGQIQSSNNIPKLQKNQAWLDSSGTNNKYQVSSAQSTFLSCFYFKRATL